MRNIHVTGPALAAILVALSLPLAVPAFAQSLPSDQQILQKQRELLMQKRREQEKTRTLLEINPQTGTTEAAPTAKGDSTVLSATPSASGQKTATASAGQSRKEAATEPVPLELAQEDQLFRPIKFAYDSSYLDDEAREILSGLCSTLRADLQLNPGSSYFVIGHTDAAGSAEYNQRLSQRRAEATKEFLVRNCDIATAQIEAVGMGKERLLASADPRAAAQRRVEIQVKLEGEGGS
ncbi:OmpA family protein [Limibaculum sp. FT325]|uniref:OmpA family protein n=1 Tax=Thermohalobaculum sediminis TaxID=2939436 RepID=UPI0020BE2EFF|nr:OmpA family protein [Limibaculum sediminis]MCL5777324.1 OmpA family protein [Limibaculum sediminis]